MEIRRFVWHLIAGFAVALSVRIASAQYGAPVAGVVLNKSTGAGVAGATVTFLNQEKARYQVTTDSSGAYRIADMDPGQYRTMIEKSGFAMFPRDPINVEHGGPAIGLQYRMQFGTSSTGALTGRVLNSEGGPAAAAHVYLIRGPELWFAATTDQDGRFTFANVDSGKYTVLAAPQAPKPFDSDGIRRAEVPTYFPSSIDPKDAQRIEIHGTASLDGFQLQTAPVHRVRGTVMDEQARKPAHTLIRLVPMLAQPPHVAFSVDSYFIANHAGETPGPDAATTFTDDNGMFEFASVPDGRWRIVAQGAPAIDPQSGFDRAPFGSAALNLTGDTNDLQIRMADPFTLSGRSSWVIWCVQGRLSCQNKGIPGSVVPIWLHAADGQPSVLHAGILQPDQSFYLENLRAGQYSIQPLPPLLDGRKVNGAGVVASLRRNSEDIVSLDRGTELSLMAILHLREGGDVLLDEDHPVTASIKDLDSAMTGSIHGVVKDGSGASVVLLSDPGLLGALVECQPDGSFAALDLAPGTYRVAAFRGIDMEALRDPELLQRALASEKKVQVKLGEAVEVQIDGPL